MAGAPLVPGVDGLAGGRVRQVPVEHHREGLLSATTVFGGRQRGALHSAGGLAVIALPSWHPKADVSTVVPRLDGPVTSFQHSFIVSEQGTAVIWGHDASGQAEQIIGQVAHPSVREELRQAERDLGLRV